MWNEKKRRISISKKKLKKYTFEEILLSYNDEHENRTIRKTLPPYPEKRIVDGINWITHKSIYALNNI